MPIVQNLSVVDTQILNLSNFTPPVLDESHPKDKIFTVICPQIRKSPFLLDASDLSFLSFYEFSKVIVQKLNIDASLKALIFTEEGQPLLFNLDLIHKKMPKLDFSRKHYILFTATKTLSDQIPQQLLEIIDN